MDDPEHGTSEVAGKEKALSSSPGTIVRGQEIDFLITRNTFQYKRRSLLLFNFEYLKQPVVGGVAVEHKANVDFLGESTFDTKVGLPQ